MVSFNDYNYRTGNTIEFNVPCGNSVMLETRLCDGCGDKAKKQYPKKRSGNAKDPRIGVTISKSEIYSVGTRIL